MQLHEAEQCKEEHDKYDREEVDRIKRTRLFLILTVQEDHL